MVELVCPRDRSALRDGVCEQGHEYPLVDGVPVLLVDEEVPTHAACGRVEELPPPPKEGIDPFVQEVIGATCGRLPFPDASFDVVFSYSVFQHFSKQDALAAFDEIGRVLKPGGESLIQMANLYGAKSLWNQARERRFREPRTLFDVRYWGPRELRDELERRVGPTRLSVDGFFTLNPQPTDLALLPARYRAVVHTSEALRRVSDVVKPLTYVADSVYARSRRG